MVMMAMIKEMIHVMMIVMVIEKLIVMKIAIVAEMIIKMKIVIIVKMTANTYSDVEDYNDSDGDSDDGTSSNDR